MNKSEIAEKAAREILPNETLKEHVIQLGAIAMAGINRPLWESRNTMELYFLEKIKPQIVQVVERAIAESQPEPEFIDFCESPCGHSSQYAYTENGGKNIECLLCNRQAELGDGEPNPPPDRCPKCGGSGKLSTDGWGGVTFQACYMCKGTGKVEPTLELGFMRSEIKMAIPRLRQDDIEWLIANFRSSAEAYAAAVSKNLQQSVEQLCGDLKAIQKDYTNEKKRAKNLQEELALLRVENWANRRRGDIAEGQLERAEKETT